MNFWQRVGYVFKPPKSRYNILAEKRKRAIWLGAQTSRLEGDWNSTILSADKEVQSNSRVLRGRARDLVKNNTYAARYIDLLDTYVIGPEGIRLEPSIRKENGDLDAEASKTIKDAWTNFTERPVTLDGKMNWLEVTQVMIRMVAQDGEVFLRKVRTKEGLKFQLIDADFLDINLNSHQGTTANTANVKVALGNRLIQGVEVDKDGVPQWYHFFVNHPDEISPSLQGNRNRRQRVRAKDIIHFYKVKNRVSQTRGITWFAPAMWAMHMLVKLQEGELVATRTSANKMGWIETSPENTVPYKDYPEDDVEGNFFAEKMEAQPGAIERLAPGEKFVSWDPDHPSTAFEAFVRTILQSISVALNVSYSSLAGDPNKESFSSARIHSVLERDHWRCLQSWMARVVHQVCYEAWLNEAILSGDLQLRSKKVTDFTDVRWVPRHFQMIDADKDSKGLDRLVAMGLTTRTEAAASLGSDFRRNIEIIAEEEAFARQHGVTLGSQFKEEPEPETPPPESDE